MIEIMMIVITLKAISNASDSQEFYIHNSLNPIMVIIIPTLQMK